ncbi:polyprenyl diphosphate synthase [Bryobacter aggregatus]|uniref:polyprenyl diphosphate synthase n=1 Tax=Bryobacter aggregatus TaxID=360054 RepID=UPI0004E1AF7A|nr:polyprenyl diphosphate synthase [Bryobacter aggregatus]
MHVAIIMDGNGRWAKRFGWPRLAGHKQGAESVRRVIRHAPLAGIDTLTLYAFSSDNWKRPQEEISGLMRLLAHFIEREVPECCANGVRLEFIGRRDRLPATLVPAMEAAERQTATGRRVRVRIAIDYSSRDMLLASMRPGICREELSQKLGPDVDLLIRTGGEKRLSDFLLWECAYAEFHFTPVSWPDFTESDLEGAVAEFRRRERRFGEVLDPSAA